MTLQELFDSYIKSGLYLRGWSPKTAIVYRRAFTSLQQSQREAGTNDTGSQEQRSQTTPSLTKAQLETWVMWMRQRNLSPACVNIYVRATNSFCSWLKEEGHLKDQIKLKQLPDPKKPVIVFSDTDIKLILAFKPRTYTDLRLCTFLQVLLDTGCRINELLTIQNEAVDFDNLLLTVDGKGGKKRKVPFSIEARKMLWRYCETRRRRGIGGSFVFCSHSGSKLMYRNAYRDIIKLCARVGITKRVHPHLTRHSFACHFMKHGGSIYSLSRILGHTSVNTTQIYIRGLGVEDFQEEHARLSPLSRLR